MLFSFSKNQIDVLVVGLEHVLPKVSNWYNALEERGVKVVVYSCDYSGITRRLWNQLSIHTVLVPEFAGRYSRWLLGVPLFLFLLIWFRPRHLEYYDPEISGRFWAVCISIARFLRFDIVILNRGGALGINQLSDRSIKSLRSLYQYSSLVIAKELYMTDSFIKHYGIKPEKVAFIYNRIKLGAEPKFERSGKPMVLYLNNFRKWKRVDLCLAAAEIVCKQMPDVEFWFVGDSAKITDDSKVDGVWKYFSAADIKKQAGKYGIQKQVLVFEYTETPVEYYQRASVFLFPSDIVFLNFSLLEAMEAGVPSIISNVEGSDRIVNDGVNGFIVPQTAEAIANKIIFLLSDEIARRKMGEQAHRKIVEDFNIKDNAIILKQLYRDKVWKS